MATYVRATYDFKTTEPGEINLRKGDVVKILHQVDDNWLHGAIGLLEGNFPASFVEYVALPDIEPGQKLFAAIRSFPAEMQGDLGFNKGDLLVGTQPVDANWWHGLRGSEVGIFPVTHISELEPPPAQLTQQTKPPSPPPAAPVMKNGNHGQTTNNNRGYIAIGRANMDLTAQLDIELGFYAGDLITITEVIDEDFAIGTCLGLSGQFPLAFVDIVEGSIKSANEPVKEKRKSKFDWWKKDANDNTEDLNDLASEVDAIHSYISYMVDTQPAAVPSTEASTAPVETYNSVPDDVKTHKRSGSHTATNVSSYDSELTPYGKTLFPFTAENPNELTFGANDIVQLTRYVDDQWLEGELDGKRGIFPVSYIEVIVNCTPLEDSESSSEISVQPSFQATPVKSEPCLLKDMYGRVLYDFAGSGEHDLQMQEGDTVTLLRKIDDNWFEAQHDDGRIGYCPVNHIEVIGMDPSPPSSVNNVSMDADCEMNYNEVFENPPLTPSSLSSSFSSSHEEAPVSSGRNMTLANARPSPITPAQQSTFERDGKPPSPCLPPLGAMLPPRQRSLGGTSYGSSSELNDAVSPDKKLTVSPGKPDIKPRSQPKPKPAMKPKPALPMKPKPAITARRAVTPEASENQPVRDDFKPTPHRRGPVRQPALQKSISLDASLDDMIQGELKASTKRNNRLSFPMYSPSVDANDSFNRSQDSLSKSMIESSGSIQEEPSVKSIEQPTAGIPNYHSQDVQEAKSPPSRPPTSPDIQRNRPSLSKKAPPRPTGPRLAPAPSKAPLIPPPPQSHDALGPKPVPARPAPPRPTQSPSRPPSIRRKKQQQQQPPAQTANELMDFSPEKLTLENESRMSTWFVNDIDDEDGPQPSPEKPENADIIEDLERQIAEREADLKKCTEHKQELEKELSDLGADESADIHENVEFYNANIEGLTEELQQLKANLYELQPERAHAEEERKRREEEAKRQKEEQVRIRQEQRKKNREMREKVIGEILQTEQDFLNSLHLCIEVFLSPDSEKCSHLDVDSLFGNIDEVVDVSQRLLTLLEGAINGKVFEDQIIGSAFVELKDDMKKVYAPYCRNHDDVIALLEKYEEVAEVQDYINRQLEEMRQTSAVFDLGSVLIKPVQRVLKYPLLLNELIKTTEEDHPDMPALMEARGAMTDVATAINEYKRQKDLVLKYRKDTDMKLRDKIALLSMHSTKKKFIRVTMRMYGTQTVDEDFNREEKKFNNLNQAVRIFVKDIAAYLDQIQEAVGGQETLANDISDYYGDKAQQEVQQYCKVHNNIATWLFQHFKEEVEEQILAPLNRLVAMFQGPVKVIKKRHDKLLDYENCQNKMHNISVKEKSQVNLLEKEMQSAKNNYEALNAQLLLELPKLYSLSLEVIQDCAGKLVQSQKIYFKKALDEMYQLLSLPLVLGIEETNVVEVFNIAHAAIVDRMSDLSFIPKAFNPRVDDRRICRNEERRVSTKGGGTKRLSSMEVIEVNVQSESQKVYLRQLYSADRLFMVTEDFSGQQMMDLSVPRGSLVGVIKEGDPMGNKDRWFVDNAAKKGFVMKRILVANAPSPVPGASASTSGEAAASIPAAQNLMDLSSPEKEVRPRPASDTDPSGLIHDLGDDTFWYSARSKTVAPSDYGEQAEALPEKVGVDGLAHHVEPAPPAYDDIEDGLSNFVYPEYEQYQAVYAFAARAPIELSLEAGQIVSVLSKEDLEGNSEWWLVKVNGNQGYAPANYLYKIQ